MIFISCADHQNSRSVNYVETTGIFDGKLIVAGNFYRVKAYKINQYLIAENDISDEQIEKYKGKKVLIRGLLKIGKEHYGPAKSSDDGRIYEPAKEPEKLFILNPEFKISD